MNVGPAVMVVSDRDRPVTVPIRVSVGNIFRRDMDVSRVMIVICFDQSNRRPVRSMGEIVLGLRHAMQVHRRQDSDAQTDVEVAYNMQQVWTLRRPV